jgi:hypothetical protein
MTFTAEQQILIAVGRRQLSASEVENLRRNLSVDLDWPYLLATARIHGLIPLLQRNTSTYAGNLLPTHIRSTWKREAVENTQSVLYLSSKVIEVSMAFEKSGVRTACFKGPLLSELAYGDIALRQAGDIDLLIAREHFEAAKSVLESLGFEMYKPLTPTQLKSHLGFHCEMPFQRDDWFTVVDLHWGLAPRSFVFALTGDEVLSRLQTVSFAGALLKTFSPEDLLLYLAMHGAKHLWKRLEWISSMAELIRQHPVSWPTIIALTTRVRATKILGLGLRLAELIYDVTTPSEVLLTLDRDESMKQFAKTVVAGLFDHKSDRIESTDSNLYNLKIMDRRRDAFLSAIRAAFVPTLSDWEALSLPPSLHSLYYAYRPLRLSKVYSRSLLHRLTRNPVR